MKVRPTVVVFPLVVIAVLVWNRNTIKNFVTGQTLSSPNSSPDKLADSVPFQKTTSLSSTWQVVSVSDGDTIGVRQGVREECDVKHKLINLYTLCFILGLRNLCFMLSQ